MALPAPPYKPSSELEPDPVARARFLLDHPDVMYGTLETREIIAGLVKRIEAYEDERAAMQSFTEKMTR